MANAHDLMQIARTQDFQDRIHYAMQNAAIAVMAELGTVTGHALRIAYAGKVLAGTADVFEMTIGVLNNLTIATKGTITITLGADFAIPDSDIQFAVNTLFNAYAGVSN